MLLKQSAFYLKHLILLLISVIFLISVISNSAQDNVSLVLPYQEVSKEYLTAGTGDQVQAVRKARVIESCMQHAGHAVLKPMNPYFATRFWPASLTLAEQEGLGWCRIGKVGTTAWSALFLLLRDVPLKQIQVAVANLTAHDLLKQTYPSRPSERMHMVKGEHGKEYFTFLVVRHPFVRLVSAYRDKLETLTEYNVRYHMKDAPRMTSRRVFNSSVADSPTFTEFADYLIRTPPNLMDKHWAPYTKVCLPCNLTYSAILKLETLEKDADWLFDKLSLKHLRKDWDKVASVHKAGAGDGRVHGGPGGKGGLSSEKLTENYFSQLTKSTVVRLYNKYKVDFEMFEYDKEVELYVDMAV